MHFLRRSWRWFWHPTRRYTLGAIFLVGAAAGIIFWGGFNTYMEYTNSLEFCTSCHEMERWVYREYQETIHYKNRTGVRVVCSDCHVPKEWTPKLIRKVKATNELFHWALGTIDTKEKFEAKRLELAENVWRSMKANDSHECRNCHSFEAMDFERQQRRPRKKHPVAKREGKTCIDCHKGIAHSLPEGYEAEDED